MYVCICVYLRVRACVKEIAVCKMYNREQVSVGADLVLHSGAASLCMSFASHLHPLLYRLN